MKHGFVTLVVIMILKHTATFQVLLNFLYSVFGTSLLWRLTEPEKVILNENSLETAKYDWGDRNRAEIG